MNSLSQIHRLRLLRLSFSTAASSPSPFSHSQRRSSDEESRSVRVSVWWDLENCSPPSDANLFKIAHSITSAVRVSGIKGPLQITAFGDVYQLSRSSQEALSSSGVTLTHVPRGGKNSADRSLLLDLMYWVSQNPPPAHLFLISGDRDFAGILHKLRMSNYNILLACPADSAPSVLCSASTIMWQWNALVKGESVAGTRFNQPPDGPYNSWYGHYKGALEDPFAVDEPPAAHSNTAAISDSEAVSPESQLKPVPRDVMRKISKIVNSFPNGISLTELGGHLFSGKPCMDKNLYGHKNFTQLLLSMPNIVRLKACANGQFLVLPAPRQASKPVESESRTNGENEESSMTTKHKVESNSQEAEKAESISEGAAASPILESHDYSVTERVEEKSLLSPSGNTDEKEKSGTILGKKGRNGQVKEGYKTSLEEFPSRKESGAHIIEDHIAPNPDSEAEMGYFRKQWTKWFEKRETVSDEKTDCVSDNIQASIPQPSNFVNSHGAPDSHQSVTADKKVTSVAKDDVAMVDVDHGDKSNHSPSFFMKILGWFKSSRKGSDANVSNESIEKSNQVKTSKRDELLLMDSFWSDVEAFLNTYKGTKVIWSSKTREEIAQNLRKEGPLVIKPLEESDLLHLIDLLISEKKWIEEHPSSTSPFRVLLPARGNGASTRMNNSGRLRSIILSPSSQPEKLSEQQDKGKISSGTTKPCCKTKDEVLVDCRKLLDDMFKESPEGISIGQFKEKFVERYDYLLDFRKLGHAKLSHLLQAMPEVRVGLKYVYPKSTAAKEPAREKFFQFEDESTSEDLSKAKYEENDSPWEELGPVDGSAPSRKKLNPSLKGVENNYESPVSDDDMSDSEGEALSSSTEEEHIKTRTYKDDSSLLQILDSWYQNEDNKSDFPQKTSDLGRSDAASGKQRPGKRYTFVVDPDEGGKDRLVDGILDNLKKSGDHKIPN